MSVCVKGFTVTLEKCIRVYPNQKPWMMREIKILLKERNEAFRSGNEAQYSVARANLMRGIREAKAAFRRRMEDHLSSNNTRQAWQGVQHITSYKPGNLSEAEGDATLAEELNVFFVPELTTTSCWRSMRCSAHCGGVNPRKSS